MNKRGLELSINFVIMLVLALAVFSLGLVFITKLFTKAEDIKFRLDKQSESELKSILSGGKQIAIYPSRIEVKRNSYRVVGVGVLNSLQATSGGEDTFNVFVHFVKAIDSSNNVICSAGGEGACAGAPTDVDLWLFTDMEEMQTGGVNSMNTILKNNYKEFLVGANIPDDATPGTYIFGVDVTYGNPATQYGSPQRFYLIVK